MKVRMRGVARRFLVHGRAVDALAGIDLDVDAGEFLCIVGPSGCGKTTLLRILAGLETMSSGEIDVQRRGPKGGGPVNAMVFQERSIFLWMTLRDNIALGLKALGVGKRARQLMTAR